MNRETIQTCAVTVDHWETQLRDLLEQHLKETGSRKAADILQHWETEKAHFVQICPTEMLPHLPAPLELDETSKSA